MKEKFNVTGFLENISATLERSPDIDPMQRIFDNLLLAYSHTYDGFEDLPFLDTITDEKRRKRMSIVHNSLYQKLNDAFPSPAHRDMLARALDMKQPALDKACAIIVEHFFENEIFMHNEMDTYAKSILAENKIELHSDLGREMIQAARKILPQFQEIIYRAVAGGVFGFTLDDAEKQQYREQCGALLEKAMNDVYERNYPDDHEPSGP